MVDARPADRFRGEAPEPRPGVRPGHIPGSLNVPYTDLVKDGKLLPVDELRKAFAAGGVDIDKPIITSCGSGISAATMWLALDALGKQPARSTTARGRNGDRATTFPRMGDRPARSRHRQRARDCGQ